MESVRPREGRDLLGDTQQVRDSVRVGIRSPDAFSYIFFPSFHGDGRERQDQTSGPSLSNT